MECNYEGVDELRRELEQGLKTIKQEAEHLVQRRAENEFKRDHEKKIASGEASKAFDIAIEEGSEPTAQAQLLTHQCLQSTSPYKYCLSSGSYTIDSR